MLTLWGPGGDSRYCDGRTRWEFLRLGGLAMGGLSLADLLQAEACGATRTRSSVTGASPKIGDHDLPDGWPGAPGYV
jgi:hypothetical protein